jgi:putative ATP-binding cassette transporter
VEAVVKEQEDLETARDWLALLSFADQQRLALARAILARPRFVFLAQLDSALGDAEQERCLKLLTDYGITYVSFGDRKPDPSLYDAALELNDHGAWKWTKLR